MPPFRPFPNDTDETLQVEAAVLAAQADAGGQDGQVVLGDGGAVGLIIYLKGNGISVIPLKISGQFGSGVSQGIGQAQLDFVPAGVQDGLETGFVGGPLLSG